MIWLIVILTLTAMVSVIYCPVSFSTVRIRLLDSGFLKAWHKCLSSWAELMSTSIWVINDFSELASFQRMAGRGLGNSPLSDQEACIKQITKHPPTTIQRPLSRWKLDRANKSGKTSNFGSRIPGGSTYHYLESCLVGGYPASYHYFVWSVSQV